MLGDVLDRRLLGERDRDGVAVVLADEDDGEAVDAGEVQGLVEVALGGGPVAEVAHRHLIAPALLGGQGQAHGMGDVGGDGGGAADDAQVLVAPVVGHLAPARAGVLGPGEHAQEHVVGRHAQGEDDAQVPVVGQHGVVTPADGPGRADLGAFVALGAHHEGGLPHAVEAPDLLVQQARQQDGAIHPDQIGVGEAELAVAVVEVEGGEVLLLDGLTHGFPLREVVRMSWMRPTSARRRSARRLAASDVEVPSDAAWAMTAEVVSKMRRTPA